MIIIEGLGLGISLVIILISCELFTNGIEWLGRRFKLGDGVVGSIFSAVGTCLPETMIPIIAILFSKQNADSIDIGIGAIMGAPFMLSTLAFFITGLSVLAFWRRRGTGMAMPINYRILSRDIGYFILVYTFGLSAAFIKIPLVKRTVAVFLLLAYLYYIIQTVRDDHVSHGLLEPLYLTRLFWVKPTTPVIVLQITVALTGIIAGAELFVANIESVAHLLGISALVLSLIITPIATELPEKFNSIIWISKRKDTLAMGNITGAMVFQSCIPVTIGILWTPWVLDVRVIISAFLAIFSGLSTYLWIKITGGLTPVPLLAGGVFYAVFILFLAGRGFY